MQRKLLRYHTKMVFVHLRRTSPNPNSNSNPKEILLIPLAMLYRASAVGHCTTNCLVTRSSRNLTSTEQDQELELGLARRVCGGDCTCICIMMFPFTTDHHNHCVSSLQLRIRLRLSTHDLVRAVLRERPSLSSRCEPLTSDCHVRFTT